MIEGDGDRRPKRLNSVLKRLFFRIPGEEGMDDRKVTRLPRKVPDVSRELSAVRAKVRFIVEAAYGSSIKKPLSLEATIGLGVFLSQIEQELAEIERILGYDES